MGFYYAGGYQPRFGPMIALSVSLHALILSFALLYPNRISPRLFVAPIYTVELVGPLSERPRPMKEEWVRPAKEAEARPLEKKVEIVRPKVLFKEKGIVVPLKKTREVPHSRVQDRTIPEEETVSIEDTINRLREKVKEKEGEDLIQRRVEEIEDKRIAHAVEELKKRVMNKERVSRPVRIETHQPVHTPTSGKMTRELLELEFKAYYLALAEKVHASWVYPGDIGNLEAIISIKIDKSGRLLERWVEKPSGNVIYDQSAIRAVEKASPFPLLPEGMGDDTLEVGIRFCPSCSE